MSGTVILQDVNNVPIFTSGTAFPVDQTKQSSLINIPGVYTFQRPADTTAYSVGDLVANSVTAGSVVPMSWTGATITGSAGSGEIASVVIATSAAPGADFTVRVHFFITTAPTFNNGDNGAASLSNFNTDKYIGYADVVIPLAGGVNAGGPVGSTGQLSIPYKLTAGDTIYGVCEARTASTLGNAAFIAVAPHFRRFS